MAGFAALALTFVLSNAAMACVLAAIAFGVTRLFRSPPLAHAVWIVVLLKLVTPPLLSIPGTRLADLRDPAPETGQAPSGVDPTPTIGVVLDVVDEEPGPDALAFLPAPVLHEDMSSSIAQVRTAQSETPPGTGLLSIGVTASAALWLLGTVVILAAAIVRSLRFDRLLRCATPAPSEVVEVVRAIAGKLGLGRPPVAVLVDARIPPLVWAFGSPARLVLPVALLAELHGREASTLIAHELAHLRRRDHWLRWPELLVVAVYWWHPVAWWARREMRRAEEECCDAWVQSECSEAVRDYASALLVTIDFLSGRRPAVPRTASGLGEGKPLIRRFEMILNTRLERRLSAALAGTLILASAALLPWAPGDAFGQTPDSGRSADGEAPRTGLPAQAGAGASITDKGGSRDNDALPGATPRARARTPKEAAKEAAKEDPGQPPTGSRTAPAEARSSGDLEERLSRLEEQVAALLGELRRQPKAATVPSGGATVSKLGANGAGRQYAAARAGKTSKDDAREAASYELDPHGPSISAVDAATGKVLWTQKVKGAEDIQGVLKSSPDQVIRIDGETGEIRSIDSKPRDLKETREELRSEMARLRKRLSEIEAREAELTKELGEKPDTPVGVRR